MSTSAVNKTAPAKRNRSGYLPAWVILALSLAVTFFLWHISRSDVEEYASANFGFRVEQVKARISSRMRGYEQALRGGVGLFNASHEVSRSEWHEYVKSLEMEQNFPGLQGIGFSAVVPPADLKDRTRKMRSESLPGFSVWPAGERPFYTSIIYLEPLDWRNRRAIGYDMYSEPVRREAMDKAVSDNAPAVSGKVKLVQETDDDIQAGFLMYLPVYRKGMPTATVEERRAALRGFVYSPFRMNELIRHILKKEAPDLDIEIFDGDSITENSLMYDADSIRRFGIDGHSSFKKTVKIEVNGRAWTIHFAALPEFESRIDRQKPLIVLAAGCVISLLFFAVAFVLASRKERLIEMNESLSEEVAERKRAEDELRGARYGLEVRVAERTEELTAANASLQKEISTRVAAEASLRESEERFRSLVETTNDWVWEIDNGLSYTYSSPMVRSILGYEPEDIRGRSFFVHMIEEDAPRFEAALKEAARSRKPFTLEGRSIRKDGTVAILETSGTPIIGGRGELLGYRGIDRDVTGRKLIEREKEQMQTQLLQSRKMELMGRLAGGVAHDFNNIMTIISSLNNLAMREARVSPLRDYLEQIQAASERAANLTRQLLIYSKNQPTETAVIDINPVIEDMLKLLKHILGGNVLVTSCLAPGLWAVQADKSIIEQLIMNLVINSKEAMPRGGGIAITTANLEVSECFKGPAPDMGPGKYVSISVRDSGTGMDEQTLKRVFEPFFSTKEAGKGIGLGLTVVQNIVKEYRGGITVASRPGEGTHFRVFLPATDASPVKSEISRVREPQGRGERILLVEDETMLCRSVAMVLLKNGYRVFSARDAEEAASIFARERGGVHLVFSDVVLKGKSGVNMVDDLLAEKPGLKVVFASGYMDIDSQWPYIKEKKFRFLQKPYEIPDLLRSIRDCLDEM